MKPVFDLRKANSPNCKKEFVEVMKNSKTVDKNNQNLSTLPNNFEDIHNPLLAKKSIQFIALDQQFRFQTSKHKEELERLSLKIKSLKEENQNLGSNNKKVQVEQKTPIKYEFKSDVIV